MNLTVIKEHKSSYPTPIHFNMGDLVLVGEEDTEFPSWVKVTTKDGNTGWAPKQYLDFENVHSNQATTNTSYSAYELDTQKGDILVLLKELNGWCWVKNINGICGWVPANTISD